MIAMQVDVVMVGRGRRLVRVGEDELVAVSLRADASASKAARAAHVNVGAMRSLGQGSAGRAGAEPLQAPEGSRGS